MSLTVLERICTERDETRAAATRMAEADDFNPEDPTFVQLRSEAERLDSRAKALSGLIEAQQSSDALDGKLSKLQRRADDPPPPETRDSWGETFVRSDTFQTWGGRGTSSRVQVEMRALPHTLAAMADALPAAPILDTTPTQLPPSLLPLVSVVNVSGNSVDYIVWSKVTSPAAPLSSAAIVAEGGDKPPIEWAPDVTSASLDTIAASTSYTRQLAQDAAAIVSFINGELQREISRKIEEEAQAALAAATLDTATGDDLLAALRMGMAKVQANGFVPNGFTVSADDLATMDLAAMAASMGGPTRTATYWGLTPVIDWTKDAGDPLTVGDFKAAVQHYRRTSVELFSTDSHSDHFTKNILDTIAEARCKTVVVRPAALVEATAAP